jgi:Protein of unknown function (DUF4242)
MGLPPNAEFFLTIATARSLCSCVRRPRDRLGHARPGSGVGSGILSRRCRVPRYVIERDFGLVGEEEMQEVAARSKATGLEHFPDIEWEHSHVCSDEKGAIKSFCVYSAPSVDRLREHAERVGGHVVTDVYEIVGDITPEEVKL